MSPFRFWWKVFVFCMQGLLALTIVIGFCVLVYAMILAYIENGGFPQ